MPLSLIRDVIKCATQTQISILLQATWMMYLYTNTYRLLNLQHNIILFETLNLHSLFHFRLHQAVTLFSRFNSDESSRHRYILQVCSTSLRNEGTIAHISIWFQRYRILPLITRCISLNTVALGTTSTVSFQVFAFGCQQIQWASHVPTCFSKFSCYLARRLEVYYQSTTLDQGRHISLVVAIFDSTLMWNSNIGQVVHKMGERTTCSPILSKVSGDQPQAGLSWTHQLRLKGQAFPFLPFSLFWGFFGYLLYHPDFVYCFDLFTICNSLKSESIREVKPLLLYGSNTLPSFVYDLLHKTFYM